jgi:hypothetical protein
MAVQAQSFTAPKRGSSRARPLSSTGNDAQDDLRSVINQSAACWQFAVQTPAQTADSRHSGFQTTRRLTLAVT